MLMSVTNDAYHYQYQPTPSRWPGNRGGIMSYLSITIFMILNILSWVNHNGVYMLSVGLAI